MRMGVKAGAGLHDVVVGDQEQPEMGVLRIVVVAEAEAVPRVEPAGPGVEPVACAADIDDGGRHGHGKVPPFARFARAEACPTSTRVWQVAECFGASCGTG